MSRFSLDSFWPLYLILIAAGLFLLLGVISYLGARERVGLRFARFLLFLRLLALAVALLTLLRPSMIGKENLREKPRLLVFMDTSSSMNINDARRTTQDSRDETIFGRESWDVRHGTSVSRLQALQQIFSQNRSTWEEMDKKYEVLFFGFNSEVEGIRKVPLQAEGEYTDISKALLATLSSGAGKGPAGILLFSDGAVNYGLRPEALARGFKDKGIPIYTVGLGDEAGAIRDVALRSIKAPATIFAKNRMLVEGELLVTGVSGEKISLQLLYDNELKDEKEIDIAPSAQDDAGRSPKASRHRARRRRATQVTRRRSDLVSRESWVVRHFNFEYIPLEQGPHKVTLRALPLTGEATSINNSVSTFVYVLSGGLNVLYLEGSPRWEYKFIKRAIKEAPQMEIDAPIILSSFDQSPAKRLIRSPADWENYDVVFIGDLPSQAFSPEFLNGLKEAVGGGLGFLMLGGYKNFGAGGYDETPAGDLLPVRISKADSEVKGEFRFLPTEEGLKSYLFQVLPTRAENLKAWVKLPAIPGYTQVQGPKPAAQVLARAVATFDSAAVLPATGGAPLLVVHRYGKGRTAAITTDSTYQWVFQGPEVTGAVAEPEEFHRRFWRQMVLFLAQAEELGGEEVSISPSKSRLPLGETLEVEVAVRDPERKPIEDAQVELLLLNPQGREMKIPLRHTREKFSAYLQPKSIGEYRLKARAFRATEDEPLGQAEVCFLVYVRNREMENPRADFDLLKRLAQISGGGFFKANEVPQLLGQLLEGAKERVWEVERKKALWDKPLLLVIFVGLLCIEWTLRKTRGLV